MTIPAILTVPSFVLRSLAVQALAAAICVIVWPLLGSLPAVVALASVIALSAATFVQLPRAWRLLNFLLPAAVATTLAFDVPGIVYLVPLLGAAAVYAPALVTRVPYYPTSQAAYDALVQELPNDRPFRFLDVGCGFGDLLLYLSEQRPNGIFVGIELGPLPCALARLRAWRSKRNNVQIYCRDMWSYPLTEFDFVYTFLSPAAMERIWHKATHEMRFGTTFITNSFPVPAHASFEVLIDDARASRLYVHRIEATNAPHS